MRSPLITITEGRIAVVFDGARVQIHCLGSRNILWEISSGESIVVETAINPSTNVYQRSDLTNNEQILFIENFSLANIAIYTCGTFLPVDGRSFSESVFITSGK